MPLLKRKPGEKKSAQGVRTAMHEFKRGQLHSGSKKGPKVKNRKQAIAIGLSEARKAGAKVPSPGQKRSAIAGNRMTRNKGRK
jgi:Family of unknown function (DUF6496)